MFALRNITAFLDKLLDRRSIKSCRFFKSTVEFRAILERERLRSNRSGQKFSLLTFQTQGESSVSQQNALLEQTLAKRLRATDFAGLLENRLVGVLLTDTPADGAWKLADNACQLLPEKLTPPLCSVYEYPSDSKRVRQAVSEPSSRKPEEAITQDAYASYLVQATPMWKRAMDLSGALIGLVIALPVMILAAIAIKLTSRGPVFFTQKRTGLGGKPFKIYKFRTMHVGADLLRHALTEQSEQDGPAFKMSDDPRVTRIGRFLRCTSIDELPQLLNVLRGEMSLVGPRPLPEQESSECARWQLRRLDVMPGLTCIWQVDGRSIASFEDWMRMDLSYMRDRSWKKDFQLIIRTIPAVLQRRGAK